MLTELRQALHRIRQQPSFALTVITVLTLASGAAAITFAVADAVIVRPLPYADPDRLAVIWELGVENNVIEVSHRDYVDWRAQARSFRDLSAFGSVNWGQRLTGRGEPAEIPAAAVSASFFNVLEVAPQLGRVLHESDDRPRAAPVAVIAHGFWQRLFGGDPGVLGRSLTLNGTSFEIVGVMPQGFDFPRGAEVWIPVTPRLDAVSAAISTDALQARWFGVLFALGRLRPDATFDQARQEIEGINAAIDRIEDSRTPRTVVLTTLEERLFGKTRPALLLLLGAVALIVLIACANVATLLLMRASRMQTETAIRLSLGALPRHLYKVWLAELLELFAIAAVAGLVLARIMLPLVIRLAPESVYRIGDAQLTVPIALVVCGIMMLAALGTAGLVSALTLLWVRVAHALRDGGSTITSSRMRVARRMLVTLEVTVACVLLVGAGLTIRSFMNLRALDLGFEADGVLTLNVAPSRETAGANRTFYAPLLERIGSLPDVIDSGALFLRPLAFEAIGTDTRLLPDGNAMDDLSAWQRFSLPVNKEIATPGFFSTMRIQLREGRYFTETDRENAPPVAIISESAARRLFPGQRAVGRRIAAGGDEPGADGKQPWRTIVGVVSDVRYRGLLDARFDYYEPYLQDPDTVKHLFIRTRANPLQTIAQVRAEVRLLDPLAIVDGVTTMEELVDRAVAPWRLNMVLFAVLGMLALATSGVGVYGVVQYAVVERWRELGIRSAFGASAGRLTASVMGEGAVLAGVGVTIGVVAAWSVSRLMNTILFGVAPTDAMTFAAVGLTVTTLVAAASYVPARLAGRADPSELLRSR